MLKVFKKIWSNPWSRIIVFVVVLAGLILFSRCTMFSMPGTSYEGDPPPLSDEQNLLRDRLRSHVETLAGDIGNRSVYRHDQLEKARGYLTEEFEEMGYDPRAREYEVEGKTVANLEVEVTGKTAPEELVIVGAHYDTADNPGADDNASGVAGVLELARRFQGASVDRTIRFVAFANEEPPFFQVRGKMGSWVYAERARERGDHIEAMVSLEMLGYYSEEEGSQDYPFPLSLMYPSTGDFIGFVGNFSNRTLVRRAIRVFREHATIPSEGGAPPGWLPGVGWSDHWAFWQEGYPAIMVTDTAVFRNPNYHLHSDRPDTLNYEKMTRVVDGMAPVVKHLASREE